MCLQNEAVQCLVYAHWIVFVVPASPVCTYQILTQVNCAPVEENRTILRWKHDTKYFNLGPFNFMANALECPARPASISNLNLRWFHNTPPRSAINTGLRVIQMVVLSIILLRLFCCIKQCFSTDKGPGNSSTNLCIK